MSQRIWLKIDPPLHVQAGFACFQVDGKILLFVYGAENIQKSIARVFCQSLRPGQLSPGQRQLGKIPVVPQAAANAIPFLFQHVSPRHLMWVPLFNSIKLLHTFATLAVVGEILVPINARQDR